MTVKDGYIPEDLSHQEITGRKLRRQAKYIFRAPFFRPLLHIPNIVTCRDLKIPSGL
jgi:hypothetical protein